MTEQEIREIGATHTDGKQFYKISNGAFVWDKGSWCRIAVIGAKESKMMSIWLMANLKPL